MGAENIQGEVEVAETKAPAPEAENLEAKETAKEGEGGDETPETEEQFPKKAVNALNRQKRRNEKLSAKIRDLESRYKELEAKYAENPLKAPDAKEYDNYADYLKGDVDYQIKKHMQEAEQKANSSALEAQKLQIMEQRADEVVARIPEIQAVVPDLQETLAQAQQFVPNVPPEIERMFYDLDEPALALYVLQKEGRVGEVAAMQPALAAAHILQAEQRGIAYMQHMQRSKVTKAPDPVRGAKGVGDAKGESAMSGDELLRKYKLK